VHPAALWATFAVGLAAWSASLPPPRLSRPHGMFAGIALAALFLVLLLAAAVDAPPIVAPEFHRPSGTAPALFVLIVVVGGGALAGYQALLLAGPVARQIGSHSQLKPLAFGGALAAGIVAVMVIAVIGSWSAHAQGGAFAWTETALTVPMPQWLDLFLIGAAAGLARIGVPPEWSLTLWSMALVALMLATLEAVLRSLRLMVADFQQAFASLPLSRPRPGRVTAAAVLVVLWANAQGPLDTETWIAFGLVNGALALACLALLAVVLRRNHRSTAPVMYPLSALLALWLWSGAYAIWSWAGTGQWLPLAVSLTGLALAGWAGFGAGRAALALHRAKPPPAK
jgi:carbon starvation protein CstA